jgi:hypothetical protein
MFPELPQLPSDEAFLHELGTSCGDEVSRFSTNGKDDTSGAAGFLSTPANPGGQSS